MWCCDESMLARCGGARCQGFTRSGQQCSITASSKMKDSAGRLCSAPLAGGCAYCTYHLVLFVARPVFVAEAVIAYMDLETDSPPGWRAVWVKCP